MSMHDTATVCLQDCLAQLRALLHQRLGWDLELADDLDDEYAPVVVDA